MTRLLNPPSFLRSFPLFRFLAFPIFLTAALHAAPPPAPEPAPTEILADRYEGVSTDTEMTSVFSGNVSVTGDNIRISCDQLEVISLRIGPVGAVLTNQNRFKSLVATGRVSITQGDREASCGKAVVLPGDNKIILTDSPMVIDRKYNATYTGRNLQLLRGERRVLGDMVKLILPPVKDLGFDKEQKLPQPPATP